MNRCWEADVNESQARIIVIEAAARHAERLYDGDESLAYDGEAEDLAAALELLTGWRPGMTGGPHDEAVKAGRRR